MDDFSVIDLFLQASVIVQLVMILLLAVSIISWIVIFERYFNLNRIKEIITLLKNKKSESWLLFFEILELLEIGSKEYTDVRNALISISKINSKKKHLIDRGLNVLDSE